MPWGRVTYVCILMFLLTIRETPFNAYLLAIEQQRKHMQYFYMLMEQYSGLREMLMVVLMA